MRHEVAITDIGGWRGVGFDEEWGGAAEHGSAAMQLNRVPEEGSGPGPGGKLVSTPAEKNAAANTIENELLTSTRKAGEHADEASTGAAGEFGGWATSAALKKVQTTWDGQVKTLMGRLNKERTGLRGTVGTLGEVDAARRDRISGVRAPSAFSRYE
ncbi:hypothetical protein [Streptomyces sp. CAU 1734]|uniref:hypothetical protein n=1 Tax=Streptomyces sp. CAU 1734 TaxID=3140360 RepID=UPI0032602817